MDEEAEKHVRHSRELLAHDRLSGLASKTRANIDIGHGDALGDYVGRVRQGEKEHDRLSVGSLESEVDQDWEDR